jgi:hypothetical protein
MNGGAVASKKSTKKVPDGPVKMMERMRSGKPYIPRKDGLPLTRKQKATQRKGDVTAKRNSLLLKDVIEEGGSPAEIIANIPPSLLQTFKRHPPDFKNGNMIVTMFENSPFYKYFCKAYLTLYRTSFPKPGEFFLAALFLQPKVPIKDMIREYPQEAKEILKVKKHG